MSSSAADAAAGKGPLRVFRPAPSRGSAWLIGLAVVLVGLAVVQYLVGRTGIELSAFAIFAGLVAGWLLGLAFWFPTMRYELDHQAVTVIYGPVVHWRIPLREIRSVEAADLQSPIWAATRLPGVALFTIYYPRVGAVRMCATRGARGIVLITTAKSVFGVTPEDAEEFTAALRARMHG